MKLSARQLEAILAFSPDVERRRTGRTLDAYYHRRLILRATRDSGWWEVAFVGSDWTIPAYIK